MDSKIETRKGRKINEIPEYPQEYMKNAEEDRNLKIKINELRKSSCMKLTKEEISACGLLSDSQLI